MKKTLTLVLIALLIGVSANSFAQCTPHPVQNIFMIPDTATDFQPAFTYMAYDQVLYISVPTDTTVYGIPVTIDSIVIVGIDSLPSTINYSINPVSGIIQSGATACIDFTGTPSNADIGTHSLTINTMVTGTVIILGDTTLAIPIAGYKIVVYDSASFGIFHPEPRYQFSVYQNSPNPFSDLTEIAFTSPGNEKVMVNVYDILGDKVFEKNIVSQKGYNSVYFSAADYKPGLYIYKVTNGDITFSRRMSIIGR
jgi:hypothetical protein